MLALILVAAIRPTGALAGAWTLAEGTGQAIVTGLYATADSIFDAQSNVTERPDFEKGTVSLLLEYGLTDRLTLVGTGEFGGERDGDPPAARPALFDASLGARLALFEDSGVVVSGQLSGRLERAQAVGGDEGFAGLDWTAPQIEPRLLAGYGFSLGDYPAFVDTQAGYRLALGDGPDEVRLDVNFGIRPWDDILLLAQGFSTISAGGDGASYAYHKAQGSLVYDLNDRWSLQAGAFATVAGHNALRERGLISAVWYRF
ncbi:hypothetical protein GTW51_05730 [Aurantimonas aggregata]|uniref:Outer membrane beta-barrel protein n=1 Tax=Aurantimonas aggregata TaxID=2047720 RepID=A0A6L9MED2_9HYPH|nr:hypothetical protein [Aurantimonas aggregata]NDV86199.1 hypothetical protein [Aurantimonas aggregata]